MKVKSLPAFKLCLCDLLMSQSFDITKKYVFRGEEHEAEDDLIIFHCGDELSSVASTLTSTTNATDFPVVVVLSGE